jgi:hypothetical protein
MRRNRSRIYLGGSSANSPEKIAGQRDHYFWVQILLFGSNRADKRRVQRRD